LVVASIARMSPGAARPAAIAAVLHVGRQIDDFTSYTWHESVDPEDHESRRGLMDLSDVPLLPDAVQVFTCGPLPFMRHVRSTLLTRSVSVGGVRKLKAQTHRTSAITLAPDRQGARTTHLRARPTEVPPPRSTAVMRAAHPVTLRARLPRGERRLCRPRGYADLALNRLRGKGIRVSRSAESGTSPATREVAEHEVFSCCGGMGATDGPAPWEASMAAPARSFGATPSPCRLSVWPASSCAISAVPRCEDRDHVWIMPT
jgi:hypothetical protein